MAKETKFPFWLVLATGVLSALLGGVIMYGVSLENKPEPQIIQKIIERVVLKDPEDSEVTEADTEPVEVSLDTETWKQYDNFEFGYSIKFPENYSSDTALIFQTPTRNIIGFDALQDGFAEDFIQEPYVTGDFAGKLFVQVFVSSLERVEEELALAGLSLEEVTIGDVEANLVYRDEVSLQEGLVIIDRGEQIILIGGVVEPDEIELFETFYSTFKLTGTAAMDEWSVYTNSTYGFSFEFPPNKTPFVEAGDSPDAMVAAGEDSSYVAIAVREALLYGAEANLLEFQVIEGETNAVAWIEQQKQPRRKLRGWLPLFKTILSSQKYHPMDTTHPFQ